MYILLPSTQADWPSLGSGISPFIVWIFSFIFPFSSLANALRPSSILSESEVNIKVFRIFKTLGRYNTWSTYLPSISLLLDLFPFFSVFFVFLFLSIFTFFTCWFWPFSPAAFFFFFLSFSFSISSSLLYELKLGLVLFSISLRVNHLNFFSSFLFSADILLNSSLVNCSKSTSWTHS